MVSAVLRALKKASVPFVVAPYEADAQIAAVIQNTDATAAITEDSDLVVYSVVTKTHFPILYKMQFPEGVGQRLVINDFASLHKRIDQSADHPTM